MMKMNDFEELLELKREFEQAHETLKAFQVDMSPTFPTYSTARSGNFGRGATVPLMPVSRDIVISSAQRELDKVKLKLRQLGVEVD